MHEIVLDDGSTLSFKGHSNTAEGSVACFKKIMRLCRDDK